MESEQTDFQKLVIKRFPARELKETPEGRYWKRFQSPLTAKQFGAVTSVEFCESKPHHLAVTASTRVIVYDGSTGSIVRKFSRFKDKAYGGTLRSDGKLLAAGGENGLVQVFDAGSRSLLRQLNAHKRPVHTVKFSSDRLHLLTGGDDAIIRWWDITSGEQLTRFQGHADYVRAAAANPANADVWATGSYDHQCKLWDVRTGGNDSMMSVDHGAPIESLAFFPSGSVFVTAGGPYLCLWDMYSGGRLLQRLRSHQKTITSVVISQAAGPRSSEGPRMLSASLDGHVKVYDLALNKVTHSSKYPAPIMSLGLAPDAGMLAVGMADGVLSLRKNTRTIAAADLEVMGGGGRKNRYQPRLTAGSYRYFIRGQSAKASADAYVVAARRKAALSTYDKMLRQFHYTEALTAALETKRPEVVASMIDELTARGGLSAALSGRSMDTLVPLVDHLRSYIADPRYTQRTVAVAHQVLDMYGGLAGSGGAGPGGDELLQKLELVKERLQLELRVQDELLGIKGMLEPLLAIAGARV